MDGIISSPESFGGPKQQLWNKHESNTPRTRVLAILQVKLTPPALIVSSPDLFRVPQEYADLQNPFRNKEPRDHPGPTYPWILFVAYPTLKVTQWYLLSTDFLKHVI